MEFIKPFATTNMGEFTFKQEGNTTVVTQTMYGKCNFMGKAIGFVMSMEKMVGTQFEKGLSALKSIVESK